VRARKVKILGISGSPRDEGTAYCIREALKTAAQEPDIEVEYLSLAKKKIQHCDHCYSCRLYYQQNPDAKTYYCDKKDDMQTLIESFLSADGYIVGAPVYSTNYSGLLKNFMDRTLPLTFFAREQLKYRVGCGVSIGGGRNSGQEKSLILMRDFFLFHGMVVCGNGHNFKLGIPAWSKDRGALGAEEDTYAMEQVYILGTQIARRTKMFAFGRTQSS